MKILDILLIIMFSVYILFTTERGRLLFSFIRSAKVELRQVIWPTKKETLHATLVVALVTILMSFILWGLDSILVHMISFILRL